MQLKSLYDHIKTTSNDLQQAKWEDQTSKSMDYNQFKLKQKQFENQHQRYLDIKRKKLSDMMLNEENQYRQEIIQSLESPDQVRLRMEAKLLELKAQKDKDRLSNVNALQQRRFYQSADELRKNESENKAIACYYEQENQMLDKLQQRNREQEEEEAYAKLIEYDTKLKIERERKQEKEQREKLQRTYDYLRRQREDQRDSIRKSAEISQLEKSRLREQWERDKQNEDEEKQKRFNVNVAVYRDIENYNRKEEEDRQRKMNFEKHLDKELINSIVEKEKALDLIDKQERNRKIKEFQQNKRYMEYQMNQKKEEEQWMDKLAQDEANNQYQRKQEQWLKEEAKRIELLKSVYKEREKSVHFKRHCREEEKRTIDKERAILDEEISKYNKRLEDIQREGNIIRKAHQSELLYQIGEKERQKKREIQDKLYEERAAYLWELDYQKKINEQKDMHKLSLAEIKNKNNY